MNAATFFNPQGRLSRDQFQTAFLVLVVLGFINALSALAPGALALAVGSLSFVLGLVLAYMWIVIWIKRLHNANVTGWMVLLIVLGYLIVGSIVGQVVTVVVAPDLNADMSAQMEQAVAENGLMGMLSVMGDVSRQLAIPNAISGALVSAAYAFLFNAVLKNDPDENRYGPAPA